MIHSVGNTIRIENTLKGILAEELATNANILRTQNRASPGAVWVTGPQAKGFARM